MFDADPGKLISVVPGRGYESFPPGVAKRIPAGYHIIWNIHYQPSGRTERDRTRIGIYFAKTPVTREVFTKIVRGTFLVEGEELREEVVEVNGRRVVRSPRIPNIPPYADNWKIVSVMPVERDLTLYALQPHAHLRSKDWQYVVTYPDGREEVLLSVPKYDFNWQLHYELQEPIKIPAGSTLRTIGHFDNSLKNPYNPGPDKEVFWSEQSWDEMFNGFFEFTVDHQDLQTKSKTQQQQ